MSRKTGYFHHRHLTRLSPLSATGLLIVSAVFFSVTACQTASVLVSTPEGFADITEASDYSAVAPYRAVSPEGVLLRVKSVENYPRKDIGFWSETLRIHMVKSGYKPVGEAEEFLAGNYPAVSFTWAVPYNRQTYIYLTAVIVTEEKILIAETAAEHTVFSRYEDNIRESLKTVSLESAD